MWHTDVKAVKVLGYFWGSVFDSLAPAWTSAACFAGRILQSRCYDLGLDSARSISGDCDFGNVCIVDARVASRFCRKEDKSGGLLEAAAV